MCATYGIGSPPHLALELLKKEAGIDVVHVPYKTFGQALPDLVSGQLSCSIDPPTSPAPQVAAGHIRAVAHTGQAPMEAFPKVDPIGKRYPVATVVGWQAIFAPAATPAPVLSKLRTEWQKTLANPAVMAKLTAAVRNAAQDPSTKAAVFDAGFVPEFVAPAQMGKRIQGDVAKFRKIAADTGIELE